MRPALAPRRTLSVLALAAFLTLALLPCGPPSEVGRARAVPLPPAPPPKPRTDWRMLGGSPQRNMANLADWNIPDFWSFDPQKPRNNKWVASVGSRAWCNCPVVAGGKVFIGTNNESPRNPRDRGKPNDDFPEGPPIDKGVLMCFDAATGKFLWQAVHDKLEGGLVNDWTQIGVVSTPVVEGDRLYYVSNRCEVICADVNGFLDGKNDGVQDEKYRDRTDADVVWRFDMIKELKVFPHNKANCSPLIAGDILFVGTSNGVDEAHINLPSPEAPSFFALNKHTGKLLWKSNLPGKKIMHAQWSSPAYGEVKGRPQVLFPGGDGWVYSFKPDTGELLWKFDANPKDSKYELGGKGTRSDFIGSPVIHGDRVYIATGQDPEHYDGIGHFWCIDATRSGDVSPELVTDASVDPPKTKPNSNSAVVWHYGGVETRPHARREHVFGRTMSTACIVDEVVYITDLMGYLHCLDLTTGTRYWQYDLKSSVWGSPLYADGKVYIGNEDGDLFVFKHDKKPEVLDDVEVASREPNQKAARAKALAVRKAIAGKYLLSKIEMETPIHTTPTVANGVLYIATESHLYAIAPD